MSRPIETWSDAQLMGGLSHGRMNCLAVLVDRHQHQARRLAYRWLGSWADADDVAQDAFVRVLGAARTYQPSATFTTWLYRIVVNLCMDHRRKQPRRRALPLDNDFDIPTPAAEAPDQLASRELAEHVRRAVDALPPRQRMALILLRYEGLTYRQIAHAMDTTEAAVDSLLSRAWAALRTKFNRAASPPSKSTEGKRRPLSFKP